MSTQKSILKLIFGLSMLCLAACTSNLRSRNKDTNQVPQTEQPNISCPILESGKWHAWLDKKTEIEGQYRLNVAGEITLPNPAFDIEWTLGQTDRMQPPGLRLSIMPKQLNQMAMQVITTKPVKYYLETPIGEFRHVSIYCGLQQLTQIVDVMLTD
jgi:hypothetical protein